jgi:acetyltransferase
MLASAHPIQFADSLQTLLAAPEVDGVLVVFPPPPMFSVEQVADALVPVIGRSHKPVLAAVMGDKSIGPAVRKLQAARIPEFRFPERAAAAMAVLADRAEAMTAGTQTPRQPVDLEQEEVARILADAPSGWLGPTESSALIGAYGVAALPVARVTTADEAVVAAASHGGPVVLKVDAPGIVHKSEVGGVQLGLSSGKEIRAAFDTLASLFAGEDETSVYVQPMAESGHDVIVGGIRDTQFGSLMMFGSGGIEVEALDDVEFALAPLTDRDVDYLISHTRAGRRLLGFRGIPGGDQATVKQVLRRVGWLISDHPRIREIEVNPLRVLSPGSGAVALDVRIRVE